MCLKKISLYVLYLMLVGLVLSACQPAEPCPECPVVEQVPCPTAEPCIDCEICTQPLVAVVPYEAQWAESGHADIESSAFRHWDSEGIVDNACATCHSASGYQDFLGADASAAGSIENTHPVENGLTCDTCHNDPAVSLVIITFPSGIEISNIGDSARCMVCHQGRSAGNRLEAAISAAGLTESRDTVSTAIRFYNIHYYAAAATLYGGSANGGYQYTGVNYEGQNQHVPGYNTCADCHDPHTLDVKVEQCSACHKGVYNAENLTDIRTSGSLVDYDGDGNVGEGIAHEISSLQNMLLTAMQTYSMEITETSIGYHPSAYPYFFNDVNSNGTIDEDEANADNAYTTWTARLLEAAYNYQTSLKDPGAYAHNPKYVIQILFDSISDLNAQLASPIDMSAAHRDDAGHFNSASTSFRHWDDFGSVEARCARCHTADGLPTYLYNGVNIATSVSYGLTCATCHDMQDYPELLTVNLVVFPSGSEITFGAGNDANLCLNCHQGAGSTASVNNSLGVLENDSIATNLRFINPHFSPAGATMFGTRAGGAYEYTGQTYTGRSPHLDVGITCLGCHDTHALQPQKDRCILCHPAVSEITEIRSTPFDFDGDTNSTEGLATEISTLEDTLLASIQAYAVNNTGAPIGYDAREYPYFYGDANQNGVYDDDEGAYESWTPRLIRAAYNYQWTQIDPGAYAHNGLYIIQVLYDSIADLGADVTAYTRP